MTGRRVRDITGVWMTAIRSVPCVDDVVVIDCNRCTADLGRLDDGCRLNAIGQS